MPKPPRGDTSALPNRPTSFTFCTSIAIGTKQTTRMPINLSQTTGGSDNQWIPGLMDALGERDDKTGPITPSDLDRSFHYARRAIQVRAKLFRSNGSVVASATMYFPRDHLQTAPLHAACSRT
jgi:hypothetical protein